MKYIDAEKLIAEIERWKDGIGIGLCEYDAGEENGKMEILIKLSSLITSLQQELPEVDLDFQVFAEEMDAVFNLPAEVTENTEDNPLNWEYAIARHFYELGLKARKK